ncbi:MAG: MFS transporter [Candidatus Omnitrophica bacterium]|nr:MFS transporter [Candidatus Omnitrophota bacterium]
MFSSLKLRDFRLYWIGMFISLIGTWIQIVAQSWLVFDLTHSAFLLGVVGFLSSIPIFCLSLFAGVAADRINKKTILLFTQNIFMILAFILAVLTQFKIITTWQIMLIALLNGTVMAFDSPARQAVVVEMVGKKHLLNGIALNSAAFNSARMIGPALAGILIAAVGMSGCFYINGISFLAVIIALAVIRIDSLPRKETKTRVIHELMEGLSFIRQNRIILIMVVIVGITSLFGISYVILMPVFADRVLRVGAKGLGMLMSSAGVGALIAALFLAGLGDFKHKGRLLMVSLMIFSVSLVAFSVSRTYPLSLLALLFVGFSSVASISLINTILQTLVHDRFRGRIMSVFMFTFAGVMPFGNLFAGALAQAWGVSWAVAIGSIICGASFLVINIRYPEIRKI